MSVLDNFDQVEELLGERLEQAARQRFRWRCGIRYGVSCWRLSC